MRGELYNIVGRCRSLNGAMEVVAEGPPPCFEVVFGVSNICDVLDKLQDLQKKQKDITKEETTTSSDSVNNGTVNNVFMAELPATIKDVEGQSTK